MSDPIEERLYRAMQWVKSYAEEADREGNPKALREIVRQAEHALEDARSAPTPDDDPAFYASMRSMLGSHQRTDEDIAMAWLRATTKDGPVPKSSTLIHELLKDEVPA